MRRGDRVPPFETVRLRKDGSVVHLSVTVSPIRDQFGTVIGASKVARDITERKRAEATEEIRTRQLRLLARISERLLLGQLSESDLLSSVFGEIGRLLGMEMLFHYRVADEPRTLRLASSDGVSEAARLPFATMRFGELLCGRVAESGKRLIVEDLQHSEQPGSDVLAATGATSYAGFPLVVGGRLLGTVAFVSATRTHFDPGNVEVIGTACDMLAASLARDQLLAEMREAERRMRDSEERLRLALESAELGMWSSDHVSRALTCTPIFKRQLGFAADAPLATDGDFLALVHPDDRQNVAAVWYESVRRREPLRAECRVEWPDGSLHWLEVRARRSSTPMVGRGGRSASPAMSASVRWQKQPCATARRACVAFCANRPRVSCRPTPLGA